MKNSNSPTGKELLNYWAKIFPCLLLSVLFFCIVRTYSFEHPLVLVPLVTSIFVLYYFIVPIANDEE
ncbi:hypothetical protein [Desulforamulus hydrothermalis]|uniref:hypothetical protein n=1 Tax=Desulforamulus hydrothermalis TaxID=412895 RepID=UPI000316AC79|nr:hypothetical protein [Desulforamulus hydrothermalis]SHH40767.1 hypothetical protein SAMN02745177_02451 [Desulforamulus hydrothermalis Lam5 = DSM 18033]